MWRLQTGTRETVTTGNIGVATQVAERISQYITHNISTLRSVGLELGGVDLQQWQQTRMLKDYILEFPEFSEITFFDSGGRVLATSRLDAARLSIPESSSVSTDGTYISPVQIDEDGLPRTTIAVRVMPAGREAGWVVGEIDLLEMWHYVDRIHVGQEGFALIVSEQVRFIAHGNPNKKRHVASTNAPGQSRTPELNFAARLDRRPQRAGEHQRRIRGRDGQAHAGRRHQGAKPALGRHRRTADRRGLRPGHAPPPRSCSSPSALRCLARSSSAGSGAAPSSPAFSPSHERRRPSPKGAWTSASPSPARTRSGSSATPSTPWLTASCSCRRT